MNRRDLFKLLGGAAAGVAVAGIPEDKPNPAPTIQPRPDDYRVDNLILTDKDPLTVTLPPPEEGRVIHIKNFISHDTVVVVSTGEEWVQV